MEGSPLRSLVFLLASCAFCQSVPMGSVSPASGGGGGGIVFQQAVAYNVTSAPSFSVSFTPKVSGSIIMIGWNTENNGVSATVSTVADGTNGAYSLIDSGTISGHYSDSWVYWVENTTTSAVSVTVTFSGGSLQSAVTVVEISGQSATPVGNHSVGNLASGTALDIVTSSANVNSSANDAIVVFGGNYTAPTWSVGATNPASLAIDIFKNNGTGNANAVVGHVILGGSSYTGQVSLNPGSGVSDFGNVIGVQIHHL